MAEIEEGNDDTPPVVAEGSAGPAGGEGTGTDDGNEDDETHAVNNPRPAPLHLLLDAGYGIPREARPRQEKILAMAKQMANFLEWQLSSAGKSGQPPVAPVTVVGCDTEGMKQALLDRLKKLWSAQKNQEPSEFQSDPPNQEADSSAAEQKEGLPPHFSFARDADHSACLLQDAVYLSPDAPTCLNPNRPPPSKVIVGLLIDRRVQLNRSLHRSEQLQLPAQRWPMEACCHLEHYYHSQEPLNVDTILEALQQWSWNSSSGEEEDVGDDTAFVQASIQAFRHHAQRHPARPQHRHK